MVFTGSAQAQSFTDLNFEQATLVSTSAFPENGLAAADPLEASAALPGWSVTYGTTPISVIFGEPLALDEQAVQMVSSASIDGIPTGLIDGNFSVSLYGVSGTSSIGAVAISQVGEIPGRCEIPQVSDVAGPSYYPGIQTGATATFNGHIINLEPSSERNGVTTMVGDVSAYAGTVGKLTFAAVPTESLLGGGAYENEFVLERYQLFVSGRPRAFVMGSNTCCRRFVRTHQVLQKSFALRCPHPSLVPKLYTERQPVLTSRATVRHPGA